MSKFNDKKIITSWEKNAAPWVTAIQEKQIESRNLVTNQAIIDAILATHGKTILDLGCGEGWLTRKLSALGLEIIGLDAVPALVQEAQKESNEKFYTLAYEDISKFTITETFDVIVCNFSLLGKNSVEYIFKTVPNLLNKGGYFIVQTLHPGMHCKPYTYQDGWRKSSWAGFNSDFCDPAPWYFRTTESWSKPFHDHNYTQVQFQEPVNPKTKEVASLIMTGQIAY